MEVKNIVIILVTFLSIIGNLILFFAWLNQLSNVTELTILIKQLNNNPANSYFADLVHERDQEIEKLRSNIDSIDISEECAIKKIYINKIKSYLQPEIFFEEELFKLYERVKSIHER